LETFGEALQRKMLLLMPFGTHLEYFTAFGLLHTANLAYVFCGPFPPFGMLHLQTNLATLSAETALVPS
jgi:hypothetical protein